MTKDEFIQLSPQEQEAFINEGGIISSVDIPTNVVCCDSTLVVNEEQKVEFLPTQVHDFPESSSAMLTQPSAQFNAMNEVREPQSVVKTQTYTEPQPLLSDAPNREVESSSVSTTTSDNPSTADVDTTQWTEGFDIKDPVELLFLLDEDVANGVVKLHKWQAEFMYDFAQETNTKENAFKACVQACNGSGKDKYIVSACVVWLCMRYGLARGVVTNGSGVQLDNQTEAYIRYLCQRANTIFAGGKDLIWKCNYRYYECIPTKSPIVLFATDEPNKAEGYHPLKAGGKMAIFASEAKAIPDSIFTALIRCTGFTHRIDVSTPGRRNGYFHDRCITAVPRSEVKDNATNVTILYKVTAFDCPHITAKEIKEFEDALPGGVHNPVYLSGVLAEFSDMDEMVVIPSHFVMWAMRTAHQQVKWIQEPYNKGGLDLSDGGAETVLVVRNGNKHLKTIPFRFDNTEDTLDFLEEEFKANELTNRDAYIYADSCGIGKPMLNALRRRGWTNIRFVDSRNRAVEPKVYLNRGTELFFNVRKLLERHELIIQEDKMLLKQMSTRYYKINNKSIHQLLTKLEQRSRGYPSPDRADAFNLAFWDYKSTFSRTDFSAAAPDKPYELQELTPIIPIFSLKEWASDGQSSLATFRRNVSKRQPINHLQRELERYIERK